MTCDGRWACDEYRGAPFRPRLRPGTPPSGATEGFAARTARAYRGRMRRTVGVVGLAARIHASALPMAAGHAIDGAAQRWELDPTFGSGGIVSTDFPGAGYRYAWGYDSAVQPDGRIVEVGVASGQREYAAVARYLSVGSLDPSFGDGGRVTIGPHALYTPFSVAFQEINGQRKILVAVATTFRDPYRYRCSVMRLNPDGTLDTLDDADPTVAFDHDGIKVFHVPDNSGFCRGMTVAPDGRVLVTIQSNTNEGDVAVIRLLKETGALDRSFGNDGRVILASPGYQVPGPVALQPASSGGSRILVGGLVERKHGYDWAVWRLSPSGALDPTFGHAGRTVTAMYDAQVPLSFESVLGLAVKADGGIVAVGDYRAWPDGERYPEDVAGVAQYTPDGQLDRTFGAGGRVHMPYDARGNTSAEDVTIDSGGQILFSGALQMPTSGQQLVGGFEADGHPDPRFGASGYRELVVGGGSFTDAASLSLDPKGRVVLGGIYGDPGGNPDRFAVVRLHLTTP